MDWKKRFWRVLGFIAGVLLVIAIAGLINLYCLGQFKIEATAKSIIAQSAQGKVFTASNSPYPVSITKLKETNGSYNNSVWGDLLVILPADTLRDPAPVYIPYTDSYLSCGFEIRYTHAVDGKLETVPLKWDDCVTIDGVTIAVNKVTVQYP